jgi:hypothetical protein
LTTPNVKKNVIIRPDDNVNVTIQSDDNISVIIKTDDNAKRKGEYYHPQDCITHDCHTPHTILGLNIPIKALLHLSARTATWKYVTNMKLQSSAFLAIVS